MTTDVAAGLAPTRHVLANGVTVLAKESRTTPAVTISAALRAGSLHDPADGLGTAHFLSRVIDRGTFGRPPDAIAETLDRGGVSLGIGVTRHALTLGCTCLTEDFESILTLVADIIRNPICPDEEVATRRGAIQTGLGEDHDNPAVRAIEGLMATLYPDGHPYGRPAKGTAESVAGIGRDGLLDFHAARVAPSTLSLVIVGDVSADLAIGVTERRLADRRATPGVEPSLETPATPEAPPCRRADDEQGPSRRCVRLHHDSPCRPGLLRDLAHGEHPGAVRHGGPAGTEHPRASGYGLLCVFRL